MIKYIKGDIIKDFQNGKIDLLAHQCNCTVGHGAGFAKSLAKVYPQINVPVKESLLGSNLFIWLPDTQQYICNMYAQVRPGSPDPDRTNFESFTTRLLALRKCLQEVELFSNKFRIGIPLVGAGLGADVRLKGHYHDLAYFEKYIAPVVDEVFTKTLINVYYL